MEREPKRKKAHHRVNVDRRVWESVTRGVEGNFSGLVSSLLESHVEKMSTTAGRAEERVTVDITVDEALWFPA